MAKTNYQISHQSGPYDISLYNSDSTPKDLDLLDIYKSPESNGLLDLLPPKEEPLPPRSRSLTDYLIPIGLSLCITGIVGAIFLESCSSQYSHRSK